MPGLRLLGVRLTTSFPPVRRKGAASAPFVISETFSAQPCSLRERARRPAVPPGRLVPEPMVGTNEADVRRTDRFSPG